MEIHADDKQWKCWVEDLGWELTWSIAVPRVTKTGHVGCKWQKSLKETFSNKLQAVDFYYHQQLFLEEQYQRKEIALYNIYLMHITRLKTRCPVCGGDADITTFMICIGGDHEPSTSIICEHCVNPGQHPLENQVGIYYFKDEKFEDDPDEQSFGRRNYIITLEDLRGKENG
jgi:hypothetical protein